VRRLRDFGSVVADVSDREIDELQAAVDARREARLSCARRPDDLEVGACLGDSETDVRLGGPGA
jgi:hypothetical protein